MVEVRVFAFIPDQLRGEGSNGGDVRNLEEFKDWVKKYGKAFKHDMGAGDYGDIFVFAWKEKANEWIPTGDAVVLSSRRSLDRKWIEVTTDAVRVYPSKVPALKVRKKGQHIIPLSARRYGDLVAKAYR